MTLEDDLLKIVPIGEENAVSGRLIWQQLGLWSPASVKARLKVMATAGQIQRKIGQQAGVEIILYFRRL